MSTNDALELHNAFIGLNEQVKYIEWLCKQLGYINGSNPPIQPVDGSFKHIPDAETISQEFMKEGL